MAKKVQPVNIPPAPSSSDDETQDQDSSSSATDDEQQPQHPTLSQNQEPQESEESDDETEDDEPVSKPESSVKKPSLQEPQESEESDDDSEDDEPVSKPEPVLKKPSLQEPQESEESDDETEDDEPVSKPAPVVKKPSLQEPQESEESDSDSDADSDEIQNSPSASAFVVKPILSEPVSKSPEQKTPTSKPARVKSSAKRPEETDKATKAVSKNQQPGKVNGGNSKRRAEVEKVENVEKSKKSKVSNGEGQSDGKVEKGSKSKVSYGEGQSVGIVKSGSESKKGTIGDVESGQVEEKMSLVKWSEEDVVKLLDGIFNYKAETGEDVNSNVAAFYKYVKDSFSVNLTKTQLYEKMRRLKKKFKTNVDKWKTGEEPVFLKPHDSELFELSKKIWGSEVTVTDGNDRNDMDVVGNANTPVEPVTIRDTIMEVTQDFWSLYPLLCASLESEASSYLSLRVEDIKEHVKEIISGMGEEKARELEDEWKAFHVLDHQLYARRAHLISKQAQTVTDLFNQS